MTRRITFTNIAKAELVDIFTQCALHLLRQNEKSVNESGNCRYLSPDGNKCAVGAFITKTQYKKIGKDIEGTTVYGLARYLPGMDKELQDLLSILQGIHDDKQPEQWLDALIDIGTRYRFKFDFLSEIPTIDMSVVKEKAEIYLKHYTDRGESYFLPKAS